MSEEAHVDASSGDEVRPRDGIGGTTEAPPDPSSQSTPTDSSLQKPPPKRKGRPPGSTTKAPMMNLPASHQLNMNRPSPHAILQYQQFSHQGMARPSHLVPAGMLPINYIVQNPDGTGMSIIPMMNSDGRGRGRVMTTVSGSGHFQTIPPSFFQQQSMHREGMIPHRQDLPPSSSPPSRPPPHSNPIAVHMSNGQCMYMSPRGVALRGLPPGQPTTVIPPGGTGGQSNLTKQNLERHNSSVQGNGKDKKVAEWVQRHPDAVVPIGGSERRREEEGEEVEEAPQLVEEKDGVENVESLTPREVHEAFATEAATFNGRKNLKNGKKDGLKTHTVEGYEIIESDHPFPVHPLTESDYEPVDDGDDDDNDDEFIGKEEEKGPSKQREPARPISPTIIKEAFKERVSMSIPRNLKRKAVKEEEEEEKKREEEVSALAKKRNRRTKEVLELIKMDFGPAENRRRRDALCKTLIENTEGTKDLRGKTIGKDKTKETPPKKVTRLSASKTGERSKTGSPEVESCLNCGTSSMDDSPVLHPQFCSSDCYKDHSTKTENKEVEEDKKKTPPKRRSNEKVTEDSGGEKKKKGRTSGKKEEKEEKKAEKEKEEKRKSDTASAKTTPTKGAKGMKNEGKGKNAEEKGAVVVNRVEGVEVNPDAPSTSKALSLPSPLPPSAPPSLSLPPPLPLPPSISLPPLPLPSSLPPQIHMLPQGRAVPIGMGASQGAVGQVGPMNPPVRTTLEGFSKWDVDTLSDWVKTVTNEEVAEKFASEQMDGAALAILVQGEKGFNGFKDSLKNDLGIPFGCILKIYQKISEMTGFPA